MEITFATENLRTLAEDEAHAMLALGPEAAKALKHRLADIRAAATIDEVIAGRPSIGTYRNSDCYYFELAGTHRLTVVSGHKEARTTATGTVDWTRVHRVRAVSVE